LPGSTGSSRPRLPGVALLPLRGIGRLARLKGVLRMTTKRNKYSKLLKQIQLDRDRVLILAMKGGNWRDAIESGYKPIWEDAVKSLRSKPDLPVELLDQTHPPSFQLPRLIEWLKTGKTPARAFRIKAGSGSIAVLRRRSTPATKATRRKRRQPEEAAYY
jgi:hypothetical protein